MVLRNTFDIYKLLALTFLFFFCVLHWLVKKRGDYLVSRGSREWADHAKIMVLGNIMIGISFIISYAFYTQFTSKENQNDSKRAHLGLLDREPERKDDQMGKIYVVIGFEVSPSMLIEN